GWPHCSPRPKRARSGRATGSRMFGISFWKVVLLAAVVSAVWFGFRWFERAQNERQRIADRRAGGGARARAGRGEGRGRWGGGRAGARTEATTHALVACRGCGAFVAEDARACNRPNCPLPR